MNRFGSNASSAAVGIDIGGTKMAVALVDPHGVILRREILPTEAEMGFARAMDRLGGAIERLLHQGGQRTLVGIGIGCAGPVDPHAGLINNPYTLPSWDHCDAVTPLRERFAVPVYLENDADVAALGEVTCGAGAGFNPVVMLTFGTGVGGAAIVDGEIYRGMRGEHPELGHMVVAADGPSCYCGTRGCLESIASGTAIGGAGSQFGYSKTRAVFDGAMAGEPQARAIIDGARAAGAIAAWTLCHTFLPQRLILGGGIMDDHFEAFAECMQQRLASATQFSHEEVSIAKASLGNDAGIVGAAMIALRQATGDPC